jgi:hypothetical protein
MSGVDTTAWKGNLPRVSPQVITANRQYDSWLRPIRDCNQNSRWDAAGFAEVVATDDTLG